MAIGVSLRDKICNLDAKVVVMGQGYVGLPLAVSIGQAGFQVIGYDVDPAKIDNLNQGLSHITDVSDADLQQVIKEGKYRAVSDPSVIGESDVIVICVPTPLRKSKDPDISYIVQAVADIKNHMKGPVLIALESTTYPGTTEELVVAELESAGFRLDRDFAAVFSPERVDPGNETYKTHNTPKIVGGVSAYSTELGVEFYSRVVERVHPVTTARAAEMAKLLENTFRAVNIGLINELALLAERMEIDIWEVIDAAASKPFGFMPFYPGPGIGGHCIPLDPMYLSWKAKSYDFYNRFIEMASEINSSMPRHTVSKITDLLNRQGVATSQSKILLLGIAYKKNVSDTRESPALEVYRMLRDGGAQVQCYDPYVPEFQVGHETISTLAHLDEKALQSFDCVVLTTNHDCFDYPWIAKHARVIFDTRNAFKDVDMPHIVRLGAPMPEQVRVARVV